MELKTAEEIYAKLERSGKYPINKQDWINVIKEAQKQCVQLALEIAAEKAETIAWGAEIDKDSILNCSQEILNKLNIK